MPHTLVSPEIAVEPVPLVSRPDVTTEEFPHWLLESPHNKALSALCYATMLRQTSRTLTSFATVRALRLYFHSLASILFDLSSGPQDDDAGGVDTGSSGQGLPSEK